VIEPEEGALASRGEHGVGRLPEPAALLAAVEAELPSTAGPWDGLKVLVSAGGTREPIDSVRFIGNRSSGRMGFALAAAAARRGAEVTLVAANVALPEPSGVRRVDVETTEQLGEELGSEFAQADVLVMAAAPADFRAAERAEGKMAREGEVKLRLEQTEDILAGLSSRRRDGQVLVGFAAETDGGVERARTKLERKGVDAIVFNDVSNTAIGFDSQNNEVTIVERDGDHHVELASKDEIAEAICDRIDAIRRAKPAERP
jgi:phosphopantothenoylcysteine decarboxylase/phosphopantothenate--cysteine ligase